MFQNVSEMVAREGIDYEVSPECLELSAILADLARGKISEKQARERSQHFPPSYQP